MSTLDRWTTEDVIAADTARQTYPAVEVVHGMTLRHTASNTTGTVAGFSEFDRVLLIDRYGTKQLFRALDGAFVHEGVRVALRAPATRTTPTSFTASGSIKVHNAARRVARDSRIWVEGIHDADLIEKVWGDDLREAAVVVEPLHGADDLASAVADFAPGPGRRLGILLDHLVEGSKEWRLATEVQSTAVLICGHPHVDIWEAVDPSLIGIERWPSIPPGRPWKEGVLEELGRHGSSGAFWETVLGRVESYRDLSTPLVNAVERLIDFVTQPDA